MPDLITVTCLPSGKQFLAQSGESLLAAAKRQGFRLPKGCRNGVCEYCEGRVLQGQVRYRERNRDQVAGSGEDFLFCTASASEAVHIELPRILAPGEFTVKTLACQINNIELLGSSEVYKVELLAPAGAILDYAAGQYLDVILPNGERNAFSIANRPDGRRIELHIQYLPDRDNSRLLIQTLQQDNTIQVELPKGECTLKDSSMDKAFFIAAGTGFTQMKALLEEAFAQETDQELYLYWGARRLQDLYMAELPRQWQKEYKNFHFVPVIGDILTNQDWDGHVGMLHDAMIKDHRRFDNANIYASGSPSMVYSVTDNLIQYGLDDQCVFSDVFTYAPRT